MGKFSIENIIIEKSSKDIQTGVSREFSDGINLICGNNEAGKSSLMSFIRNGFFKVKGIDKGKIYFKINNEFGEKHFRTDIQDNRSADLRCKVFDENNTPVSYDFIENIINKKYFEQGFTINLDDLMNIQNKDTQILVDTIKDPSGEKLADLLDKIKIEAKKILGDNNRLTKETSAILDNIAKENIKINELSNLENNYNSSVQLIKEINLQLDKIYIQEEYFAIIKKLKNLYDKLNDVSEQLNIIRLKFNENLYNNQQQFAKILQNSGKLEANKTILQKNTLKTELLNKKIYSELNQLRNEFLFEPSKEDIQNFNIDYGIIRSLKDILSKKADLGKELVLTKQNKDNIEENILKLKHEIQPVLQDKFQDEDFNKLQNLFDFINENLSKYNYLQSQINEAEKLRKISSQGIVTNRNLLILFSLLLILSVSISIISFMHNIIEAGIFGILTDIFLIMAIIAVVTSKYTDAKEKERKQIIEMRDAATSEIKNQLKDYSSDIVTCEMAFFPIKIESIKNEIQNKLQEYNRINDLVSKNTAETAYNIEKLDAANKKIEQLMNEIDEIDNGAKQLIKSTNNKLEIPYEVYIPAVEAIKNLKEDMNEYYSVVNDSIEIQNENIKLMEEFNEFVKQNHLQQTFGDNYADNIQKLKAFNETNNELKNNINILASQIENINRQIKQEEDKKALYTNIENNHLSEEELLKLKNEKLIQKKEAEFQKRNLEEFEGLNDLKIKKSLMLEEYRKKIYTLVKDKMILQITKTAKDGFDKVQPDLKNAQKYLEILTEGKYCKIDLDLEEIQNSDGSVTKKWSELSRGTKEQVYFALRLGYASNYAKDRITMLPNGKADLPLIIDDAFVNFDSLRTRQGIKCLIEFAKNNQVLFFTCHNEIMKKHFEELCNEANLKVNVINI